MRLVLNKSILTLDHQFVFRKITGHRNHSWQDTTSILFVIAKQLASYAKLDYIVSLIKGNIDVRSDKKANYSRLL